MRSIGIPAYCRVALWNHCGGRSVMVGELPDGGGGPSLVRAVQDQLGLRLNSTKGRGEIVSIDHVEKVPTGN